MARLKLFTAWFGWERSNWAEPSIRWASKLFGSMVTASWKALMASSICRRSTWIEPRTSGM